MTHLHLQVITKHILVVSYVVLGCSYPPMSEIKNQPPKKPDTRLEATKQKADLTMDSYALTASAGKPGQLSLDNAVTEVTQYLQRLPSSSADNDMQRSERYEQLGKQLLQQVEELKKSEKKAYRMADRNFLYNTDVSGEGMYLLHQQMRQHGEQLKSLRSLRGSLLQAFHFSRNDLLACKVKVKPCPEPTQEYEIDSSDEEKLTYSRGELALRRGGWHGLRQGIVEFPRHFYESLQSMLLDKSSTVDKVTDYLLETPDVSGKLAECIDSLEGNEEEKGKEIGKWITTQVLLGISEICQANFIKHVGKAKLIKALLKVIRTKHQQATKKHKLTQKGIQEIGKLASYQEQTAQEVLKLCKDNIQTPAVQQKSYWHKPLAEVANLAARGDKDAQTIVEFLKKGM